MKHKGLFLLLLALLMFPCAGFAQEDTVIVTSFYPMYIFAQNIAKDIPGVSVVNMADQSAGCLHQFQIIHAVCARSAARQQRLVYGEHKQHLSQVDDRKCGR